MTGLRNSGNQVPNPDAVSQFNVATNNYSAQVGRYSSAVVSVITKSGSNRFHGSVFEFFRDRNFNAIGPLTIEHNTLLVDGHGQGNEGKGHDVWAGFPYTRVNLSKITQAKFSSSGFDVEGEGAGAYDESLKLNRYLRHIIMKTPGKIEVEDHVESNISHQFAEVLHSDMRVKQIANQHYEIRIDDIPLDVQLSLPANATAKIEKNIVMGPGRPGSVDKGSSEERGERLVVSTPNTVTATQFRWSLKF